MTVAASPQPPTAGAPTATPAGAIAGAPTAGAGAASAVATPMPIGDTCPLCGTPLHPEQEWCLRCGAAARTRLSASPNWRAPIIVVAVIAVLSLGVLAAALVKLAGDDGATTGAASTTTVATTPAASTPATAAAPAATVPATTAIGAATPGGVAPAATTPAGAPAQSSVPAASPAGGASGAPAAGAAPSAGTKTNTTPQGGIGESERIRKLLRSAGK